MKRVHARYLAGILCVLGLAFIIPTQAQATTRVRWAQNAADIVDEWRLYVNGSTFDVITNLEAVEDPQVPPDRIYHYDYASDPFFEGDALTMTACNVSGCSDFSNTLIYHAPTPTYTPTFTPTQTPTITVTFTPTQTPTFTPTITPTITPTRTFTPTITPTKTMTPTQTPTETPTNTPTPTKTNTPTATPTVTLTPIPTPRAPRLF